MLQHLSHSEWSLKIFFFCLGLGFSAPGNVSQEKATPTPQEDLSVSAFEDGNELLRFCEDKSDSATSFCLGYIVGTADDFKWTKSLLKFSKLGGQGGTCLPERVTPQQLIDVFLKFARNHPEERHKPAQYMITMAWGESFPC
jgi:Rap1a immunity proteins